jgi:WD40 repeat protein
MTLLGNILCTPLHSSTGRPVKTLEGHADLVTGVRMLSDLRLVSVGRDGMIFLWEGGTGHWVDQGHGREDWDDQRQTKCPRIAALEEEAAEVEFMPAIMRNYLREGDPPR